MINLSVSQNGVTLCAGLPSAYNVCPSDPGLPRTDSSGLYYYQRDLVLFLLSAVGN